MYIVVNPVTGGGRGRKIFEKTEPVFRQAGIAYEVIYSGGKKSIQDIVAKLTAEASGEKDGKYTDIVIIGGDGSMNEAINGIADFEHTRIGYIPAGSGNDLARGLGLPKNAKKAALRIVSRKTIRTIDIGEARAGEKKRLFNISSGIGFDAESCYYVDHSRLKRVLNGIGLGKLIYITVAIFLIIKNRRFVCRIETGDGKERIYDDCLFAVCMNHRYEGGGFMFCPEAADDDGMLDFCVVNGIGPAKFFRMFPTALKGRHTGFPQIDIFKAEKAVIHTSKLCHIHVDGEAGSRSRKLKLSVSKNRLKLLV
ncbi:MAG: diacylglycerol kinase family lipid kinase [Lachnospiraceae bacterium]|nr:diacylglycerol kinase family lipid kinase [Lachnospiraceae bacterium]